MMRFIKEPDGTTSAVVFDYIRDGWRHEEAFFAEVAPALGGFMLRWNCDYNNPLHFATEAEAKAHANTFYNQKTFHSNGKRYEIGEI